MEMSEEIYANVEMTQDNRADSKDSENSHGDVNQVNEEVQRPRSSKQSERSGGDTAWSRWSRLIAVCLVLLCVLLLIVVIMLSIKYNNLTSNNNVTIAREQFRREREELERFLKLGWTYSSSSVYSITTEQKSWTKSRQDCIERGADLVIITSTEEQEFVNKLRGGGQAWIGLNYRDSENKWKWVDDTALITEFWGDGEPNSAAEDEDCVITGDKADSVNNWGDYPCKKEYIWICEKTIFN